MVVAAVATLASADRTAGRQPVSRKRTSGRACNLMLTNKDQLAAMRDAQLVMLAHFEEADAGRDRRSARRRILNLQVPGASDHGSGTMVVIHDLSSTGLLLEATTPLRVGSALAVELPRAGTCPARVVWKSGSLFGCQFDSPISKAAVSAALLRSPGVGEQHPSLRQDQSPIASHNEVLDKLPLRTRMWIHVGLAACSAMLIGAAISLIF